MFANDAVQCIRNYDFGSFDTGKRLSKAYIFLRSPLKRKGKILLSPMTKALYPQKAKKSKVTTQRHHKNLPVHNDYGPTKNGQVEWLQSPNWCDKTSLRNPNLPTNRKSCVIKMTHNHKYNVIVRGPTIWTSLRIRHHLLCRLETGRKPGERSLQKHIFETIFHQLLYPTTCSSNTLLVKASLYRYTVVLCRHIDLSGALLRWRHNNTIPLSMDLFLRFTKESMHDIHQE